jgi:hypothetical protein
MKWLSWLWPEPTSSVPQHRRLTYFDAHMALNHAADYIFERRMEFETVDILCKASHDVYDAIVAGWR